MRIGLATPVYEPRKGGAERCTADLIGDLAAAGHEVHVWAAEAPRPGEVPEGVEVHRLLVGHRGGRGAWRFAVAAWAEMRAVDLDIIHSVGRTFYHNVYQSHGGTAPATLRANLGLLTPRRRRVKRLLGDLLSTRWQIYRGIERRAICEKRAEPPLVLALSQMVKRDLLEDYTIPEERRIALGLSDAPLTLEKAMARIERFDEMGASIKSYGRVGLELYPVTFADGPIIGDQRLYRWDIELKSTDDQRQYYDPIIRGYAFRLEVPIAEVARRPTLLRITFRPPDADRLTSEAVIRTDW